jgi:hypothetical protein
MGMFLTITLFVVVPLLVFIYVFGFIFIHGSVPAGSKHDNWITETCAPEGLHISVMTWGYFKLSCARCLDFYRLLLFPQARAKMGKKAPDAKLVDLKGKELSLLHDYIEKMPKGMPLILNMGSYT